ncbi:hypothetical protein SAMN06265784_12080 [Paraburkholderia susongensis]|uniref:Uncharacterized protein n=2 Tax=Paraburkholderia susongensis TaxID=1515439 RepID=A0A1X7M536_9BURK|nr:hypothetical protein SAMN06265784_12080 [Paraburkholderia susongensis]
MRSSDSTSTPIGFTAGGDLNATALLAFVGAGDGRIVTWYDQTGYGQNMTQSVAARQPLIVTAGSLNAISDHSTLPGILSTGTSSSWQYIVASGNHLNVSQPCTRVSVNGFPAGTKSTNSPFLEGTSNATVMSLLGANNYYRMYDYNTGLTSANAVRQGDANIVNENYNTTSSSIIVNGTVTTGSVGI